MAPRVEQKTMSTQSGENEVHANATQPVEEEVEEMVKQWEWDKPVAKSEFDRAREIHDIFTLIILLPVLYYSIMDFQWAIFDPYLRAGDGECTEYHYPMMNWFLAYVVVDFLWIFMVPHCTKGPKTLLAHHAVAVAGILLADVMPCKLKGPWMSPLVSVEINSYFAIARRVFWKRKMPWLGNLNHVLFMSTWCLHRCIIFPIEELQLIKVGVLHCVDHGLFFFLRFHDFWLHTTTACAPLVVMQGYFVYLNLKWTRDLFGPIVRDCGHWLENKLITHKKKVQ